MRVPLLLVALSLVVSGCLSGDDGAVEPNAATHDTGVTIDEARPDPTFQDVQSGTAAGPDLNATLAAPPKLVPGEYWKIHFTSPLSGADVTFTRVVAAVDGDTYVIGMPHEGWYKEAVVYHTPAFGDVNLDLSYHPHDVPFLPLKFPLTDGATWDTHWENEGNAITAKVKVVSPTEAEITFTQPNGNVLIEMVYDATLHEVRSFKEQTAVYEVVEHGYDFEGWITVPRGERLVFLHGRLATPILGIDQQPAPPMESVEISGGYNRMSFILVAGNALVVNDGGAYSEKATAPDGTVYELQNIPGNGLKISFLEHKDPDGTWNLEHLALGPGLAFIEGIAYHQYDIHLPSGQKRADHSHEVIR